MKPVVVKKMILVLLKAANYGKSAGGLTTEQTYELVSGLLALQSSECERRVEQERQKIIDRIKHGFAKSTAHKRKQKLFKEYLQNPIAPDLMRRVGYYEGTPVLVPDKKEK